MQNERCMDLKEYCLSLTNEKLLDLALNLCNKVLPIWENYCDTNSLTYQDSVVGERHAIDKNLLIDSLNLCRRLQSDPNSWVTKRDSLLEEFLEPECALQDSDWSLPYPVKTAFYAIYNLLRGFQLPIGLHNVPMHYISVNQAVDALQSAGFMTFDEIKELIST
jgi:hypothetical protein